MNLSYLVYFIFGMFAGMVNALIAVVLYFSCVRHIEGDKGNDETR